MRTPSCPHGLFKSKCNACRREAWKLLYPTIKEKRKLESKIYYLNNKEKALNSSKKWRENNPEASKKSVTNWQILNREKMKQTAAVYRDSNKQQHCASQAKRKSSKLKRTPKWANQIKISSFYQNCPKGMHVDHIIPLQGKLVSGLHVETNLQYLTPEENLKKNNKFIPDQIGLF